MLLQSLIRSKIHYCNCSFLSLTNRMIFFWIISCYSIYHGIGYRYWLYIHHLHLFNVYFENWISPIFKINSTWILKYSKTYQYGSLKFLYFHCFSFCFCSGFLFGGGGIPYTKNNLKLFLSNLWKHFWSKKKIKEKITSYNRQMGFSKTNNNLAEHTFAH